ncbi:MAG: metal-sensitive transcriptional regulator [Candidatus Spechtbacterales bacterium]
MDNATRSKVLRRLKIIEGQVRGLQRLAEEDTYCVDILGQTSAVKEALSSVENTLLENHLNTCVVEQMQSGQRAKAVQEMVKVYKLSKRT